METKKLQEALRLLESMLDHESCGCEDDQSNAKFITDAHAELAELQKLASVVKEFIKDPLPESNHWHYIDKFRDIVGYKE